MEKAILILDMPENCIECPIAGIMETYIYCNVAERGTIDEEAETRPDWCPLRPLPEKKVVTANDATAAVAIKYGWNNCIDELLRKE